MRAIEIDIDCISDGMQVVIGGIMQPLNKRRSLWCFGVSLCRLIIVRTMFKTTIRDMIKNLAL